MKKHLLLLIIMSIANIHVQASDRLYLSESEVRTMMKSDQRVCIFGYNGLGYKGYLGINQTIFNSLTDEMNWLYIEVCDVTINDYEIAGDHGRVIENLYTDGLML